jgi:hypothetical protein
MPVFSMKLLEQVLFVVLLSAAMSSRCAGEESAADDSSRFAPTSEYAQQRMEGWRLLVHRSLTEDSELAEKTLTHLRHHLYQITRVVPGPALKKLQSVTIWVEKCEPHHPCMAYHPDPGWLREHDMNPEKARCVELANAETFLKWTHAQPAMVLHELAHAYHHQFLDEGFDNPDVKAAYRQAMESDLYKQVLHINGRREKGYASTNPMEYFAETAEAYFGVNDFYPFVRSELQEHDAAAHALQERLWRERK